MKFSKDKNTVKKNTCNIHTVEFYSVVGKNENQAFTRKWMVWKLLYYK